METATVKTEKVVFGGQAIAKISNKTVFIPYALPDEILSVNIVQHKNDYDNAEIIKIIEPSVHRKNPECKYYGSCGGCNMMHILSDFQRELRKQMLADSFLANKIELPQIQIISGPDYNYRSRFQFTDGGLCQKNSNNIITVDECLCAEPLINEYLASTPVQNRPKGRSHFFASQKATEKTVKITEENTKSNQSVQKSKQSKSNSKKYKFKENKYFAGTALSPQDTVTVQLNGKNISFDVRGFFQSNLFVFEKVLKILVDSLPQGKNVLDMYSGCGAISCFLGEKFQNVTLVEHNRDALVFAEQNMTGTAHTSYGMSGASWVKNCASSCPSFDACVVDPPRSGMEKEVLNYLCSSNIPFIAYLSCNPSTQSRDCAKLLAAGYHIENAYLLDFYPNTSHIESLVTLRYVI